MEDMVVVCGELDDLANAYKNSNLVKKCNSVSKQLLDRAGDYLQILENQQAVTVDANEPKTNDNFEQLYMNIYTEAFGDELNKFREEETFGENDVSHLIDCIKAGMDVFTPLQKQLIESGKSV